VVKKIARETPSRRTTVALYDWGEPTIHPHLPDLIGIVHQHGLRSKVSSNLNVEKTLEPIIKANPHEFHVSLSGFHQETYSRTHATGNIEMVKENIRRLRTYIDRFEAATRVVIGFHVYRHNFRNDLPAMRRLAKELGFEIDPIPAHLFPSEKRLVFRQRSRGETPLQGRAFEVTEQDEKLVDLLLVRPEEIDAWFRGRSRLRNWIDNRNCQRIEQKTSIRVDGSVPLCCVTYDPQFTAAPSFLDLPHEQIQRRRRQHPFCRTCMKYGLHLDPGGARQKLALACARGTPDEAEAAFELLERTRSSISHR
jgi:hypothetical protein